MKMVDLLRCDVKVQMRRGVVVAAAPIRSVCGRGCRSAVATVVRGTSFAGAWWCA